MAIAFDTSSTSTMTSESVETFSHTCTGSNLVLFVHCGGGGNDASVASVTYNTVSLTQGKRETGSAGGFWAEVWYLIAPATGAHNVVVTLNTADDVEVAASSYTGVAQTSTFGTWASVGNTAGTDHTLDVSSAVGETVVDFAFLSDETTDLTAGAGQTERYDYAGTQRVWSSTEPGATTVTMSWSDGAFRYDQVAVSMRAAAPDTTPMKGVGQAG
jgi:hypothetical protein